MKKVLSILLVLCLMLGTAACDKDNNTTSDSGTKPTGSATAPTENAATPTGSAVTPTEAAVTPTDAAKQEDGKITIAYPANMQQRGFTEPVVLDKKPEKVVSMSTAPVLALNRLGINFIAVPKTSVVTWPENMKDVTLLNTSMNSNFDIETVIVMEPDLVILGATSKDTYGGQLTDAGIPVYYVDAGHTVSYESVKAQTEVLVEAFGKGTAEGEALLKAFSDLESKLAEIKKKLEGKTVMILQSSPPSHYIQTENGTLGTMAKMIGLTNVYVNDATSMAEVDFEQALSYDPDLVLTCGMMPSAEGHKQVMEEDFAKNPDYWNAIKAIKDGNIIYLPVSFTSTAGISILDRINELSDIVLAHFGLQ